MEGDSLLFRRYAGLAYISTTGTAPLRRYCSIVAPRPYANRHANPYVNLHSNVLCHTEPTNADIGSHGNRDSDSQCYGNDYLYS